jgi:8-oxo-dGTP pyrophosphatase MutT (NUDIX family)
VIAVAQDRYVLLAHGVDPAKPDEGDWWLTPGGGLEPGETPADAARRELIEEVGFDCGPLGDPVFEHVTDFDFDGVSYSQHQTFFIARVAERFEVDRSRESPLEKVAVSVWRWWPIEDLRTTTQTVYPENLVDLLAPTVG